MVYLDQFIKKKPSYLLKGQARERMIGGVMESLKHWRFSEFEHEAAVRRVVRQHFVERGNAWGISDLESENLLAKAFERMGVKRPSWLEGQWQYTAVRCQCLNCGTAIDEEDQLRGYRYCSAVCAKAHKLEAILRQGKNDITISWQARREIRLRDVEPKACQECGKMFKSLDKSARYCSLQCVTATQRLPEITCGWCIETFAPKARRQKYCCLECAKLDGVRRYRAAQPEQICPGCQARFRPGRPGTVCCSRNCSKRVKYRASKRASNVIYLTAEMFDGWFKKAA